MDRKKFYTLFGEALKSNDRDAFLSDWALSSIWGDACAADIPDDRLAKLAEMWDAAHRSVRQIAGDAGLSQRQLAERFCIAYRTVEDWCRGLRTPPDYVRLMMQECLGMIDRS